MGDYPIFPTEIIALIIQCGGLQAMNSARSWTRAYHNYYSAEIFKQFEILLYTPKPDDRFYVMRNNAGEIAIVKNYYGNFCKIPKLGRCVKYTSHPTDSKILCDLVNNMDTLKHYRTMLPPIIFNKNINRISIVISTLLLDDINRAIYMKNFNTNRRIKHKSQGHLYRGNMIPPNNEIQFQSLIFRFILKITK